MRLWPTQEERPFREQVVPYVVPLMAACLWEAAGRLEWLPRSVFAPLSDVVASLWDLSQSGRLWVHVIVSSQRLGLGMLLGGVLGLVLGCAVGANRFWARLLGPFLGVLIPVPPIAWIPLLIVLLGINGSRVGVIAVGSSLIVYSATASGVRGVSQSLIDVARIYQKSRWDTLWLVLLPASAWSVVAGLRAALGVSWVLLVASELIASTNGLGWLLNDARNFSRPAEMLAACLSISACGILTDIALARAQRYFGRWDTRFRAE